MLKLGRVTKVRVLFLVLVFVFNFDLFQFSAAILEKGLLTTGITSVKLLTILVAFSSDLMKRGTNLFIFSKICVIWETRIF